MKLHEELRHFNKLASKELYQILRLRSEVFIVEQNCAYQDLDNKDLYSHHLMISENNELIAYARLLPAGLSYPEVSIGRVVTSASVRGKGVGKILMQSAIAHCYSIFGKVNIKIGAQVYATKFYESLGFVSLGDVYDEDGIDHVHMLLYAP